MKSLRSAQERLSALRHALRREYRRGALDEADCAADPLEQFTRWFDEAADAESGEPNAAALATSDANGMPSVRMVLIRDFSGDGFTFFTSYGSRKGSDLEANPNAALLFYWPVLERQVRIEGSVRKVEASVSDAYFAGRPKPARLAAIASKQSAPLPARAELDRESARLTALYAGDNVPRPTDWGGYVVAPAKFEFWQGRENRLHDRIVYELRTGSWVRFRLYP